MKKRWSYMFILCLSIVALSFSAVAYAHHSEKTPSKQVAGQLVSVKDETLKLKTTDDEVEFPLASNPWVYLDDKKTDLDSLAAGTYVTVVLNNLRQAAFINASSAQPTPSTTPTATPTTSETPTPTPTATATVIPTPTSTTAPTATPTAAATPTATVAPTGSPTSTPQNWDKLLIKIKSDTALFSINQKETGKGVKTDIKINLKSFGHVHLKGQLATDLLNRLIASANLTDKTAQDQFVKRVISEFNLDPKTSVSIQVWVNDKYVGSAPVPTVNPAATHVPAPFNTPDCDKDDHDKGYVKDKDEQKDSEKTKAALVKAAEQKAAAQKAALQKAAEQKAAAQKADHEKAAEKKATEKKAATQKDQEKMKDSKKKAGHDDRGNKGQNGKDNRGQNNQNGQGDDNNDR
ncbi:hypothetical protein [Gorillibacterium massiliense]|uniref:hypothetical protein n=1 Tax=Gorillibacterium massiliense TaxID=1280390 RepID=UPI0004B25197|nr:hypothetical protein [Gorillibacterium massiliense]